MVLVCPDNLPVLEARATYDTVLKVLHQMVFAFVDAWRERPAPRDSALAAHAAVCKAHGRCRSRRALWTAVALGILGRAVAGLGALLSAPVSRCGHGVSSAIEAASEERS